MEFLGAFIRSAPIFGQGLVITLALTGLTIVFSVILGLIVLGLKVSRFRVLNWVANTYLAIVRGMPLIALLFVIYFGIVSVIKVDAFTAATVGLSIHTSAYMAEIFRSGLSSVPKGQMEAARSLGMSRFQTMRRIISPQALRVVVPALANQAILSLKDSSVAAFITVDELFLTAQRLSAASFQPLVFYTIVSIYYLAIVGLMTLIAQRVERYYGKRG
jgi:His/Glu/Gln/Arg/opine family amino acid ABC transporter permease subunit